MTPIEWTGFAGRLRLSYERGRLRTAVVAGLPSLALLAFAYLRAPNLSPSKWLLGMTLFGLCVAARWWGRSPGRAMFPGLAAAAVAFGLVQIAGLAGHVCVGGVCTAWCTVACTAAGVGSGLWLSRAALRAGGGLQFWLTASALVWAAGSLACHCVGHAGMVGMAAGLVAVSIPHLPRMAAPAGQA